MSRGVWHEGVGVRNVLICPLSLFLSLSVVSISTCVRLCLKFINPRNGFNGAAVAVTAALCACDDL